jgi:hypothetical protein
MTVLVAVRMRMWVIVFACMRMIMIVSRRRVVSVSIVAYRRRLFSRMGIFRTLFHENTSSEIVRPEVPS